MRVVQIEGYGPPEVLMPAERADPVPGAGEIRIRVAAIGVNPADFKWRSGMLHDLVPLRFPHVIGYDVAGTVDMLGAGVAAPPSGTIVFGMLSHVGQGGYAEYAVLPAEQLVPVPAGLAVEAAAALPTAALTGVQMVEAVVRPAAGSRVLVTGALGAVGRFALHAAIGAGAVVVAAVRSPQRAQALALGAAEVVVLGEPWTGPPFDHVLDTVGGAEVAALCRHVRRGGRICTVSTTPIPAQGLPSQPVFYPVHHDPVRLAALARSVAKGAVTMPIAAVLPLSDAAEAHRRMEAGGVGGKIVLIP